MRTLAKAASVGDPTSRQLGLHALAPVASRRAERLLLDALKGTDTGRREHAAWALAARPPVSSALAPLRALAAGGEFGGMLAGLTLDDWLGQPWPTLANGLRRKPGGGPRVAQVSLQGRLDARLQGAGAGDGGGLATLLVSLTRALDSHPGVSEVVTFTRAFEDSSLPGVYSADLEPLVCHGGNNTAMEALTAGLPVVALPFSTDQFAVAADIVASGLGAALDPNRATKEHLAAAVLASLEPGTRVRAARLGRMLQRDPGAARAANARPPGRGQAGPGCCGAQLLSVGLQD